MPGRCEHGLTTRECMVCASPKRGAPQTADKWVTIPRARLAELEALEGAWVPCAERLPDRSIFFLAFGPGLGNYIGGPEMDICKFDGDLWVEGGTELAFQEQRFTHWMPLPAPPQSA